MGAATRVLKYGVQIADALDKAHRTGARPLDSELAKRAAQPTAATRQSPVIEQSTIAGAIQYMSPEQVEGKELDARSDVFSLGAVLYELLNGQRVFPGKSQPNVGSAILEKETAPIITLKSLKPWC